MKRNLCSFIVICFVFLSVVFSCDKDRGIPASGVTHDPLEFKITGPVSVTGSSYPFNAADHSAVPQKLAESNYIEEEYFVSGGASVYDFDSNGKVIVKYPDAPYTTRILIRRPADKTKFSGNVIVELNNPTSMFDMDLQWMFCRDFFIENGDIWAGITVKPVSVKALQKFNPERYASLSMANPAPAGERCKIKYSPLNDTEKETENGLVWDIVSQVGRLFKSQKDSNPIKDYNVEYLFATGYSQTGGYLTTYINLIHPLDAAKLDDGKPIFDGYMIGDGDAFMVPINQCLDMLPPGEKSVTVKPCGVPVISVVTQGVLSATYVARRPDSDSPSDMYRRYEIPGAAHVNQKSLDNSPSAEDSEKAGAAPASRNCEGLEEYGTTDFPIEYFMNSAYMNLYEWVKTGVVPPKAEPIKTEILPGNDAGISIKTDEYGNALGGVRHPYVEAPIATYHGSARPLDEASAFFCTLAGYKVPFDNEKIKSLYPVKDEYLNRVGSVVDDMVEKRFLTKSDGEKIKEEAGAVDIW